MKKTRWIVLGALMSACMPTQPYTVAWREGATAAQADSAQTDCLIEAANRVPQSTQAYTTPVYRSPSNVQCTTYGNYVSCHDYGGQVYGGQTRTYDANAELRRKATEQCLAKRGFSVVSIPVCTTEQQKKGVTSTASGKLPAASAVLCAVEGGYIPK